MRAVIFYFSATGNTARIAKGIRAGVTSVTEHCDLVPINKHTIDSASNYDVLFIGGPIWWSREPVLIRRFVYSLPDLKSKPVFLFNTHGASPTGFFFHLSQNLKKKNAKIYGWKDWYCDASMPSPYMTHGHPDDIDDKSAYVFGKESAQIAFDLLLGKKLEPPAIPNCKNGSDALWVPSASDVLKELEEYDQ